MGHIGHMCPCARPCWCSAGSQLAIMMGGHGGRLVVLGAACQPAGCVLAVCLGGVVAWSIGVVAGCCRVVVVGWGGRAAPCPLFGRFSTAVALGVGEFVGCAGPEGTVAPRAMAVAPSPASSNVAAVAALATPSQPPCMCGCRGPAPLGVEARGYWVSEVEFLEWRLARPEAYWPRGPRFCCGQCAAPRWAASSHHSMP